MVGHYKRSKFLAEREAIAAAQASQQVIILNPPLPSAPTTPNPRPPAASSWTFSTASFPPTWTPGSIWWMWPRWPRPCGCAYQGPTRPSLHSGRENLTLKQILDKMSAITGIPSPTVRIPFAVAATYAFFEEWITGRIRGREPRATLAEVRMGRKKMYASSAHAQQELRFRIVPVYPAMRAAIEWFRRMGTRRR